MKCGTWAWANSQEWALGHYGIASFDDVSCLKLPPLGGVMNRWWLLIFRPGLCFPLCSKKINRCQHRGILVSGQYIIFVKMSKTWRFFHLIILGKGHELCKSFFCYWPHQVCHVLFQPRTVHVRLLWHVRSWMHARAHARLHVQCGCGTSHGSALLWQLELWRAQNPWRLAWHGMAWSVQAGHDNTVVQDSTAHS